MSILRLTSGLASYIFFMICVYNFGKTDDLTEGIYAIIFLIIGESNLNNVKEAK